MLAQLPVLDAHRVRLRQAFADRLASEHPDTVLDLGAGGGELVALLRAQGIDARGIEPSHDKVAAARTKGLPIFQGRADKLNERPGSVDWVTFRHVLHHLHSPERAIKEAARIAGKGMVLAEPFSMTGLAPHRATVLLEAFTRFFDRRRGMVHGDDLTAADILSMVPADWDFEMNLHCPLTMVPQVELERILARAVDGFELDDFQRSRIEDLRATASATGLAAPGTLIVVARRPGTDR